MRRPGSSPARGAAELPDEEEGRDPPEELLLPVDEDHGHLERVRGSQGLVVLDLHDLELEVDLAPSMVERLARFVAERTGALAHEENAWPKAASEPPIEETHDVQVARVSRFEATSVSSRSSADAGGSSSLAIWPISDGVMIRV